MPTTTTAWCPVCVATTGSISQNSWGWNVWSLPVRVWLRNAVFFATHTAPMKSQQYLHKVHCHKYFSGTKVAIFQNKFHFFEFVNLQWLFAIVKFELFLVCFFFSKLGHRTVSIPAGKATHPGTKLVMQLKSRKKREKSSSNKENNHWHHRSDSECKCLVPDSENFVQCGSKTSHSFTRSSALSWLVSVRPLQLSWQRIISQLRRISPPCACSANSVFWLPPVSVNLQSVLDRLAMEAVQRLCWTWNDPTQHNWEPPGWRKKENEPISPRGRRAKSSQNEIAFVYLVGEVDVVVVGCVQKLLHAMQISCLHGINHRREDKVIFLILLQKHKHHFVRN